MLKEKVLQSDLILYELMKNPVLCTEFIHNVDKDPHEEEFKLTYYQKEGMCDFSSYSELCSARAVGKTVELSSEIIWLLTFNMFPTDYIVFTVPNKVHLEPVFTSLVRMFRSNSYLKNFLDPRGGINSGEYTVKLLNNSALTCRIAGQSGTGANVIGLHSPAIYLDEGGYYPYGTWLELQPVENTWTSGFRMRVSGVPTGLREKNVLYHCDKENTNYRKHRVSSLQNPRFTEEDRKRAVEQYGGEDSDDYIHMVLGLHGKPVFALFDRSTFEIGTYPSYRLKLDGIDLKDNLYDYFNRIQVFPGIPEKGEDTMFGIDLGYCYAEDTEVLTNRGWLRHNKILSGDKIACYDTVKDKIIFDDYLYLWEQNYKGKMIEVSGKSTNFLVSPEHSIWINKYKKNEPTGYGKYKAKDLLGFNKNRFKVKLSAKSNGVIGPKSFTVPYYYCDRKDREVKNIDVKMSDWVEFLGWFISEGSATDNKTWCINMIQLKNKYSKLIDNNLSKLPYTISRKEYINPSGHKTVAWQINCKELCIWLRENCGVYSKNKKIPDFIFNCSSEDKEIFLKTLLLGDGSRVNSSHSPQYNSQSELLVDQVQQLAISLGYSSTKGYYKNGGIFRCSIMNRQENELTKNRNVKEVDYSGKIYCLKTNTGFYVTRRKGKVAIQGNTEPTAIMIFRIDRYARIRFHGRIQLNKVSYPLQERIIDELDTRFNPILIGMDKGGVGLSVFQNLLESKDFIHKNYKKKLIGVDFSSNILMGTDADGKDINYKTKPLAVSICQDYSNNHKIIYTSTDLEFITELERMTYTKTPSGDIVYRTLTQRGGQKGEDHFTSAFLCGILTYYLENDYQMRNTPKTKLMRFSWL